MDTKTDTKAFVLLTKCSAERRGCSRIREGAQQYAPFLYAKIPAQVWFGRELHSG
jgi:hypothetical protein